MFTKFLISFAPFFRRSGVSLSSFLILSALLTTAGCGRFRPLHHEYVYVSARQSYLHDRIAAVSNRVAPVTNGQRLEVLDHGRRFLKVKTEKNEIGWIEERATIDKKTYDAFLDLVDKHKQDPVVSTATVRDEIYLHVLPGRETDHFYLLQENAKVQILARTSVPKVVPGMPPALKAPAPKANQAPAGSSAGKQAPKPGTPAAAPNASAKTPAASPDKAPAATAPEPPPPPALEDWLLIRDAQGHAGWLLAGRVDVDVPDEIGTYAEGQRTVGAYLLTKVTDEEATTPNHVVPEYVTFLSAPKSGLPYDFDQVRVFTWSLKRHRYETAFRLRGIQGYLPVKVTTQATQTGSLPTFTFQIGDGYNLTKDPSTGATRPTYPRTISYMLVDTQVKRTGSDLGPLPTQKSDSDSDKAKQAKQAKQNKKKGK